ncbi:MAG: oxygenase MpaB family protein [Nakamurella sp.]
MSLSNVFPVPLVRRALSEALRGRVAGDDAAEVGRRIWTDPGERWFETGSAIHVLHQDASMFVGGLRSLLMQMLHPAAMAGVAGHSGYKSDPWGRLQRTSTFLAMTTYGPVDQAEDLIAKIRGIHERVRGKTFDGRPYAASDPHLLRWVHLAEADSFLNAYERFGAAPTTDAFRDEYVAQTGLVAAKLGVIDPPQTHVGLQKALQVYRPELGASPLAWDAAKLLLLEPPLPLAARPGYGMLAAAAVSTMPAWARRELRLPRVPLLDWAVGEPLGKIATSTIRWAMVPPGRETQAA